MLVRDVMSAPVFTIREDKTLRAVDEIMKWARIRCLPVLEDGNPMGIITEADLLRIIERLPVETALPRSA